MEETTNRINYLAEQFDIFETQTKEGVEDKIQSMHKDGLRTKLIESNTKKKKKSDKNPYSDTLIAILSVKQTPTGNVKNVSVSSDVFASIVTADPTENKMYVQWILNLFTRMIKDENEESLAAAIRLVDEDLPQANNYLTVFEGNKRKKKFKTLSQDIITLKNITDPADINQYTSLSQLFDAVDPFIEKDSTDMERSLNRMVEAGQALIPVRDRKYTVYIPLTRDASTVFAKFANWCTARDENGMFASYTSSYKKPDGSNSNLYIIINNKFFSGESDELYQIHFETDQVKDKKNGSNVKIYDSIIKQSEAVADFFYKELMKMAKQNKKGLEDNRYLNYLLEFGFIDSLFEFFDTNTEAITITTKKISKIPDITRFKKLKSLTITGAETTEIDPSIGKLTGIEMLHLADNKIEYIPKEIGNLKNLIFLSLGGNKLKSIPKEIAMLDKSNGGSLHSIGVTIIDSKESSGITEEMLKELKALLPTTNFNTKVQTKVK